MSQRQSENTPKYKLGVYWTWPVFIWRECECCGVEFRRESGWRFLAGPFYQGAGTWRYLCGDCGLSKAVAHEMARTYPWDRPNRPPPSPNPPSPRLMH